MKTVLLAITMLAAIQSCTHLYALRKTLAPATLTDVGMSNEALGAMDRDMQNNRQPAHKPDAH